jgi:large subunit ribosomal protein L29
VKKDKREPWLRRGVQMGRVKLRVLQEMNQTDLTEKLSELKAELLKLKSERAKGTLKKETGSIRWIRRDIARILTILNERESKRP